MQRKVVVFIICTLLITATGFSVVGTDENQEGFNKNYTTSNLVHSPPLTGLFEWPMFRYNLNNSGYSPSLAPDDNTVIWSKYIGDWVDSNPTIKDGRLYIVGNNFWQAGGADLWCLNPFDGSEIWKTNLVDELVWGAPTVANDRLYVLGVSTFNLYCINADTGSILWTYPQHGHCSPMVFDNKVYFSSYGGPSNEGGFFCLNATTGDLIWSFDTTTNYQASTPAIVNGRVYVGNDDAIFYCLNADSGDVIWNYDTQFTGNIWDSPSVYNNKVYFSAGDTFCLDANTGDEEWVLSGVNGLESPAIAYGNVYICRYYGFGTNSTIACFDTDTGELNWESIALNPIGSAPAVADGKIYVNSGGEGNPSKFICIDAFSGEIIWDYALGGTYYMYSSPAVAYGNVYVGAGENGYIYAFGTPNQPPETPSPPDGPTEGFVGVEYTFNSSTTDPEGDDILYLFDWGDGNDSGWLGPYGSGENVSASYSWDNPGDYDIRVKAKDSLTSFESDMSPVHTITIVEGPILEISAIFGGLFKIKAIIKNIGDADAIDVHWYIAFEGGLILIGRNTSGENLNIPPGGEETVSSSIILGFGQTTLIVKAWIPDGPSDTVEMDMFLFWFFIYIKPGGGIYYNYI